MSGREAGGNGAGACGSGQYLPLCMMRLETVPGEMVLPPDVPEDAKVSEDALETPSGEW